MPKHLLAEKSVQEYLLLEKHQLNLEQKIEATKISRRFAEARQDFTKVDSKGCELARLNYRLQQVSSDLKKYPISIPETISNTLDDRCRSDINHLTPQDIKTEIVRLEHRRNALWIYASHKNLNQNVFSKRQWLISQSIESLQTMVSTEKPPHNAVQKASFFHQTLKRDLSSSHDMRLRLQMSLEM